MFHVAAEADPLDRADQPRIERLPGPGQRLIELQLLRYQQRVVDAPLQ
jgi:hypothetical protein